jgi:hypothetical protein
VNGFVCNQIATDSLSAAFRLPFFAASGSRMSRSRVAWQQAAWIQIAHLRSSGLHAFRFQPLGLRSLAVAAALIMSLFISAEGADAELKSEWKFGGSLARLVYVPITSAILGNEDFGTSDDVFTGRDLTDVTRGKSAMLPQAAQPTGGSLGGLFNRPGLVGGFSAGFLGAGVLGVIFGHGMTSELTGVASFFGLIFQITLILMLARLFWSWWRVDSTAGFADLSPRELADAYGRMRNEALPDVDGLTEPEFAEANNGTFDKKD